MGEGGRGSGGGKLTGSHRMVREPGSNLSGRRVSCVRSRRETTSVTNNSQGLRLAGVVQSSLRLAGVVQSSLRLAGVVQSSLRLAGVVQSNENDDGVHPLFEEIHVNCNFSCKILFRT